MGGFWSDKIAENATLCHTQLDSVCYNMTSENGRALVYAIKKAIEQKRFQPQLSYFLRAIDSLKKCLKIFIYTFAPLPLDYLYFDRLTWGYCIFVATAYYLPACKVGPKSKDNQNNECRDFLVLDGPSCEKFYHSEKH